jgi:CheY-like chemotaxis protein
MFHIAHNNVALAAGELEAALRFQPGQADLLLLDLNLPDQSGWDIFEELTRRQPFVPVINITGMPNQHCTAVAAGAGALPARMCVGRRMQDGSASSPRGALMGHWGG